MRAMIKPAAAAMRMGTPAGVVGTAMIVTTAATAAIAMG
jgi:hypothetical protein